MATNVQNFSKNNAQRQTFTVDPNVKSFLIDYLYQTIPVSRYRYKILQTEKDLEFLKSNEHYVSPNFVGFTYLLVFVKRVIAEQETYLSYFIDRKTLKYNKDHIKLEEINVYPVKIKAHLDIYEGTILDGISIFTPDRKKIFLVTDVYFLGGSDLTHDDLKYKLINFKQFIDNKIIHDPKVTHVSFQINKLYAYPELKSLVHEDIPINPLKTRGLVFYPKESGSKILYNFAPKNPKIVPGTDTSVGQGEVFAELAYKPEQRTHRPVKSQELYDSGPDSDKGRDASKSAEASPVKDPVKKKALPTSISKPVHANFSVKKTILPDVYELYLLDNKILKKQGIAYIPTQKSSQFCRSAFEDAGAEQLIMRCDYSAEFQKWVPYKLMRKKTRPDKLEKAEKKLGII